MVMWVFAVQLELVSPAGKEGFASFLLPGMALSLAWIASIIRILRSSMLDVLDSEYIRLARVKGLPEWKVISKHALRNAAIGPLTYFGLILGSLLAGSVSIETVFDWPGLGPLAVEAAMVRDYPLIQGVVLLFGALFLMINLLVDILYGYLDPRVRYA
jgi:peptide/nickel transport system permease protein